MMFGLLMFGLWLLHVASWSDHIITSGQAFRERKTPRRARKNATPPVGQIPYGARARASVLRCQAAF